MAEYREYRVQAADQRPLLQFMLDALKDVGCAILYEPPANVAPFRITFETPAGERLGIISYAFRANSRRADTRLEDEYQIRMKYGSERANGGGRLHELWQDPCGLYTTLLVGIDVGRGVFIGAEPVLHNPTKLFTSITFKRERADRVIAAGWHNWEHEHRLQHDDTDGIESEWFEVLVGGTKESFLRYVRFERDALGEAQGHRQLLAERADGVAP